MGKKAKRLRGLSRGRGGEKFSHDLRGAMSAQPFVDPAPLLEEGIILGQELNVRGAPVFSDPYLLPARRISHAPNYGVVGMIEGGKSTFLKVHLNRLCQRRGELLPDGTYSRIRFRVDDHRREDGEAEYAPMVKRLGGKVIVLNQMACIDPLAIRNLDEMQMLRAVTNLFALYGIELVDFEPKVLQVAIYKMKKDGYASLAALEARLDTLNLRDLRDYNLAVRKQEMDEATMKRLGVFMSDAEEGTEEDVVTNIPEQSFRFAAAKVSAYLNSILRGEDGYIFGTKGSLYESLRGIGVCLDWKGVPDRLRTVIHTIIQDWEEDAFARGDRSLIPNVIIMDEQGEAFLNKAFLKIQRHRTAKSRELPTVRFYGSQYPQDFTGVGEPGSEHRFLAQAILRSFGGWYSCAMQRTDDNVKALLSLGFSQHDVDFITSERMGLGCFAFKATNASTRFFNVVLNQAELKLVQTNSARDRMLAQAG